MERQNQEGYLRIKEMARALRWTYVGLKDSKIELNMKDLGAQIMIERISKDIEIKYMKFRS